MYQKWRCSCKTTAIMFGYLHHKKNDHDDNGNVNRNNVDNLKHVKILTDVNINQSCIGTIIVINTSIVEAQMQWANCIRTN